MTFLSFIISMLWHDLRSHWGDCYFHLRSVKVFNTKSRKDFLILSATGWLLMDFIFPFLFHLRWLILHSCLIWKATKMQVMNVKLLNLKHSVAQRISHSVRDLAIRKLLTKEHLKLMTSWKRKMGKLQKACIQFSWKTKSILVSVILWNVCYRGSESEDVKWVLKFISCIPT